MNEQSRSRKPENTGSYPDTSYSVEQILGEIKRAPQPTPPTGDREADPRRGSITPVGGHRHVQAPHALTPEEVMTGVFPAVSPANSPAPHRKRAHFGTKGGMLDAEEIRTGGGEPEPPAPRDVTFDDVQPNIRYARFFVSGQQEPPRKGGFAGLISQQAPAGLARSGDAGALGSPRAAVNFGAQTAPPAPEPAPSASGASTAQFRAVPGGSADAFGADSSTRVFESLSRVEVKPPHWLHGDSRRGREPEKVAPPTPTLLPGKGRFYSTPLDNAASPELQVDIREPAAAAPQPRIRFQVLPEDGAAPQPPAPSAIPSLQIKLGSAPSAAAPKAVGAARDEIVPAGAAEEVSRKPSPFAPPACAPSTAPAAFPFAADAQDASPAGPEESAPSPEAIAPTGGSEPFESAILAVDGTAGRKRDIAPRTPAQNPRFFPRYIAEPSGVTLSPETDEFPAPDDETPIPQHMLEDLRSHSTRKRAPAQPAPMSNRVGYAAADVDALLEGDELTEIAPPEMPGVEEEYTHPADAQRIRASLIAQGRRQLLLLGVTGAIALILLWIGIAVSAAPQRAGVLSLLFSFILLCASAAVNLDTMRAAGKLLAMRADADTGCSVLVGVTALYQLVLMFGLSTLHAGNAGLFAPIAGLMLLASAAGKYLNNARLRRNFAFVSKDQKKDAVVTFDRDLAERIAGDTLGGHPVVISSRPATHLTDFFAHSSGFDPSAPYYRLLVPLSAAGAFVVFLVSLFATKNFLHSFSNAVAALCAALPLTGALMLAQPLYTACARLFHTGAMLSGYDAVDYFGAANVIAAPDRALFPDDCMTVKSVKTYAEGKLNRALADAGSLAAASGGPMAKLFSELVQDTIPVIPQADTMTAEEGMGLAGYVGGRRVIVGSRQLLESHGISAPDIEVERRLQRNGGYPLYVAEDGALCALLSIGYEVDERIAAPLRRLIYREGFSLAVATRDPNCTGAMLRKLFRLPKNTADTMAAATADSFRADTEERVEESGGMAYTGGFPAFAALLESVVALGKGVYRALIAMCVLAVLGLVAVLEYSAFGDAGMTTLIPVLLFQLVATAALFVSTNFRRK